MNPFRANARRKMTVMVVTVFALATLTGGAALADEMDDPPGEAPGDGEPGFAYPWSFSWNHHPIPKGQHWGISSGGSSSPAGAIADALDPNECEPPLVPEITAYRVQQEPVKNGPIWTAIVYYDCVWPIGPPR